MALIGPAVLTFAGSATDFGDDITQIQKTTPEAVTVTGINRDHSAVPSRGHALVLSGVEKDLRQGTLWRWLYDHRGQQDVDVAWSTTGEGVSWTGKIAVVPDPSQGGQANQHGTFNVTLPLVSEPTLVDGSALKWDVTVTGSPTGGTYRLILNGSSTADIAYNAAVAAVVSALNALSGVTGISGITGTGTGTFELTFPDEVGLAATSALTGGSTPGVTVAPTAA